MRPVPFYTPALGRVAGEATGVLYRVEVMQGPQNKDLEAAQNLAKEIDKEMWNITIPESEI
jgi:hypothetical protein